MSTLPITPDLHDPPVEPAHSAVAPASGGGNFDLPEAASVEVCVGRWPSPAALSLNADEARALIPLPAFDPLLLEKARVISSRFPLAEAEYRKARLCQAENGPPDLPHFERVFQIAATLASVSEVQTSPEYDALLVLTAWHSVRPQVHGFLSSYPKALLCPLSHLAPPTALAGLSAREQSIFERRAPVYLRYLLYEKFALRSCADIENADLRHLLRSTGFRLVRPSVAPELAFPGITQGEDPAVRPWKLTLRQELSDERAVQLLITAALWKIKYDLRLVSYEGQAVHWNIGAFSKVDWEDAFLSLGVRVAPSLLRESGLIDWRSVLNRCIERIGQGNLPAEVLGKVSAWPQRISHDSDQAIWRGLDQIAQTVVERVQTSEPQLFGPEGELNLEAARAFRRWARYFDEVSPQVLSRLGVSAFTALRRVAPDYFGWDSTQLKPWELEQEYGKWKGPRGRALLKSAYAFALFEDGLGTVYRQEEQVWWRCTLRNFSEWYGDKTLPRDFSPYEFLYGLASRHGLTPLLNREITHTAAVSLLAGITVHENLPKIEGCWELCLRTAIEQHNGTLEVRLDLPEVAPLPLRLRKAVLTPLTYGYLHKELRLVRDFDLRMARESHRRLEEVPGWWEDERVAGTPIAARLANETDPARQLLGQLRPEPWVGPPTRKLRFRALNLLISRAATIRPETGRSGLSSDEMRVLLRFVYETVLPSSNIVQVTIPAVRRGFERLLARDDTREMLESLLLHIGTAYETEVWGQVRKFVVLDVVNDLLALGIRCSLLHLMSTD